MLRRTGRIGSASLIDREHCCPNMSIDDYRHDARVALGCPACLPTPTSSRI